MNLKLKNKFNQYGFNNRSISILFVSLLFISLIAPSFALESNNNPTQDNLIMYNSNLSRDGTVEGFADGDGTNTNPWIIETPEQLDLVRNYLGTGNNDKHFKLGRDIDLSDYLSPDGAGYNGGAGWIPIGKGDAFSDNTFRFTGKFDGDGYIIKNLAINSLQSEVGLFGSVGTGGVVKNLGIVGGEVKGRSNVGGMVGFMVGATIENCYTTVNVNGVVGVGGLLGWAYHSTAPTNMIENCYATGDITGEGGIGGLVGNFFVGTIRNCYATGNVYGGYDAGGLVGSQDNLLSGTAAIENCYAMGNVFGIANPVTTENYGGLVGKQKAALFVTVRISNCYATGSVSGVNQVGGLVGLQERGSGLGGGNIIEYCYATGSVEGVNNVGGFIGERTGSRITVTNCYFDTDATGVAVGVGVGSQTGVAGLSTEQMTEDDTLESGGAMATLGNLVWSKRAAGSVYCYYPELSVFYGDGLLNTAWKVASELSVRVLMGNGPQLFSVTYTVMYTWDDVEVVADTYEVTKDVWALDAVDAIVDVDVISAANDRYLGYKLLSDPFVAPATAQDGDVIVVAYVKDANQLKDVTYTVKYTRDGVEVAADTYEVTKQVWVLDPPTVDVDVISAANDRYLGYKLESDPFVAPATANDGDVITVAYIKDSSVVYDIFYDLHGGVNAAGNPLSYFVGDSFPIIILDPFRVGYDFLGWTVRYANGSIVTTPTRPYSIPAGTTGNIVLTALWLRTEVEETQYYTVIYEGNGAAGGVPVDVKSPYVESSLVLVLGKGDLALEGHSFMGWTLNPTSNVVDYLPGSTFTIYENTVLHAVWAQEEVPVFTVIYAPGLHGTFKEQVTLGLLLGDPTPQAPIVTGAVGWKFIGWTPTPTATVVEDVTYVAQWEQVTFTVRFVDWDGTLLKTQTVAYGGSASAPANPVRAGYTFTGWDRSFTNVVSDLTVTAQYSQNNSGGSGSGGSSSGGSGSGGSGGVWFTVQFVDWNGALLKSERVRSGGSATAPQTPTREGYTFTNWNHDFTNVRSDLTVTAQYEPKQEILPPPVEELESVWALANLILSITGFILVVVVLVFMLVQQKQQKNNKSQNTTLQSSKQQKQRKLWLIIALALSIAGILVFLLTEDMSHKMTMIDNWTTANAIIFIAEIIALTLIFKHKKEKTKKP